MKPGGFDYDNMCMSIGRLFENLTFDVETASNIVHDAWIENYTYWITNKPWKSGYRKPRNTFRNEQHEKCAATKYANLPDDEKEKDRVIARYIINNHLEYKQFVKSFTPRQLDELEDKTSVLPRYSFSDSFNIHPTIIVNETEKNILKKTIDYYKTTTNNAHIYDFTRSSDSKHHKLYLGPTSQVALTSSLRGKLAGARGVVISVDEVNGEELPLVRFLDGDEVHIGYINGVMPLMMASYVALETDIQFKLEMCLIDGELIKVDNIGHALEKARTFDCVQVKNTPSWTPETVLDLITDPQWKQILGNAFTTERNTDFLQTFSSWVWSQYDATEIFAVLNSTTFDDVKVVIIGQDPYYVPKKSHGLSFSIREIQPSLINIYAEMKRTGFTVPTSGNLMKSCNLMKWVEQGVLLLNSVLTVGKTQTHSHVGKGWDRITDEIIKQINFRKDNIVFMLWGAIAEKKCTLIDINKHCVLKTMHPSPMATSYVGCNCFRDANNYLISKGHVEIDWNLSD